MTREQDNIASILFLLTGKHNTNSSYYRPQQDPKPWRKTKNGCPINNWPLVSREIPNKHNKFHPPICAIVNDTWGLPFWNTVSHHTAQKLHFPYSDQHSVGLELNCCLYLPQTPGKWHSATVQKRVTLLWQHSVTNITKTRPRETFKLNFKIVFNMHFEAISLFNIPIKCIYCLIYRMGTW